MQLSWKVTGAILLGIVVLTFTVRFVGLGTNSFVADEFLDMNSSYGYFKTGEWRAWDFNFGVPSSVNINDARDERANIYKWQVAQLFHVFPPTEETARLISVLWGALSSIVVFWSAYVFTRRKEIGLIASFLFALSVSSIIFDRRLRMYAMFFPLYLGLATVVYQLLETKYRGTIPFVKRVWEAVRVNVFFLPAVLLLTGLSFLTHQLTGVLVLSVFAYLLVMAGIAYKKKPTWKQPRVLLLGLAILGVIAAKILVPNQVALFLAGLTFFDDHYSYLGYFFFDYAHPVLAAVLMLFGAWYLAKKEDRSNAAWYVSLSALVPLAVAIWLFRRNAGPQYIFFAQSFGIILVSIGVFGIWRWWVDRVGNISLKMRVGMLALLLLLMPNFGYFLEENNTYHETSTGGNPNYRKVFDYFRKNKQPTDVLVTRNFRNYYWAGTKTPVIDLGDEINRGKMTREALESVIASNASGWIILSTNDYDYFSNEAEEYMKRNLMRVSNPSVRGAIDVYRWGTKQE